MRVCRYVLVGLVDDSTDTSSPVVAASTPKWTGNVGYKV